MNKKILAIVCILFVSFAVFGFALDTQAVSNITTDSLNGCKITQSNIDNMPSSLIFTPTLKGAVKYCEYALYDDCGMVCLLSGVYNATNWIFVILMAISALMIIFGAVLFTTSSGDPTKTEKARGFILYAAVGIAVAVFARAVPAVVKMIVGA